MVNGETNDCNDENAKQYEAEEELRSELNSFTGTQAYHILSPLHGGLKCTDGIKYLAEKAQAFWLIDAIASYMRKEPVQFWHLEVKKDKAVLTMKEDSDQPILVTQKIGYTDFPFSVDIWVMDGVVMLPSEY